MLHVKLIGPVRAISFFVCIVCAGHLSPVWMDEDTPDLARRRPGVVAVIELSFNLVGKIPEFEVAEAHGKSDGLGGIGE